MKNKKKQIQSGTVFFEDITLSENVLVTDPCYDRDLWCVGYLSNVRPGTYETSVTYSDKAGWGMRVTKLRVKMDGQKIVRRVKAPFSVGVDSGQAGVFDNSIYPKGKIPDYSVKKGFYRRVCDLTLGDDSAGTFEGKGFVSSSGFGDGCYTCTLGMNAEDEVVSIEIKYL